MAVEQFCLESFVLGEQLLVGFHDGFIHVCQSVVFLFDDGYLDSFLVELIFQFLNFLVLFLGSTNMLLLQLFNCNLDTLHFLLNRSKNFIFFVVFLSEEIIVLQLVLKIRQIFLQLLIFLLQKFAITLKKGYLLLEHYFHPLSFIFPSEAILILCSSLLLILTLTLALLLSVHVVPLMVLKLLLEALTFRLQHGLIIIKIQLQNSTMTKRIEGIKEIVAKYSTYFFDLDGVVWKGSQKVKGGFEALHFLREQKKRIFFITNSSRRSKQMVKDLLASFGFQAELDEIYPSDFITRQYVNQKYPQLKKLLVIGTNSLSQEIKKGGKEVVNINSLDIAGSLHVGSQELKISIDPAIDGVIMGYDKNFNYNQIVLISAYLQSGAKFIGTNPDKYTMVGDFKIPGCGSMIKCIQESTSISADYAGKPNPFIINYLINSLKLIRSECLMIGDNLQTDITFGINGGIDTLCVLTGVTTQPMVKESNQATYYSEYLL